MYKGAKVAAVVPAYKEEKMIAQVIKTMPAYVDFIVIVDDCSPDDTSNVAKSVGDPRVTVIRHEVNQGVGGAIITAHTEAMRLGSDVNVVMAGDAQMDPDYLPGLLDKVTDEGYGFAKANRFYSAESFDGMPKYRIFGNIILSFLTKAASGYWHLFDPQNGYTAIRSEILRRIPFEKVAKRYSFENDLLIHLNILQVPACDVSIPAVYGSEVSSIRLSKVVPELVSLLVGGFWRRIWYRYVLWSFSPIALLLFAGVLAVIFGMGIAIWTITEIVQTGQSTAATVMLAALPILIGTQMLISALQLDIQESPDRPNLPRFLDETGNNHTK